MVRVLSTLMLCCISAYCQAIYYHNQSQTSSGSTATISSSVGKLAYGFWAEEMPAITGVVFFTSESSNMVGTIRVAIETDNAGVPSGTELTYGTATATFSRSIHEVTFSQPATLTPLTHYWVVFSVQSYTSGSLVLVTAGNSYILRSWNGSAWSSPSRSGMPLAFVSGRTVVHTANVTHIHFETSGETLNSYLPAGRRVRQACRYDVGFTATGIIFNMQGGGTTISGPVTIRVFKNGNVIGTYTVNLIRHVDTRFVMDLDSPIVFGAGEEVMVELHTSGSGTVRLALMNGMNFTYPTSSMRYGTIIPNGLCIGWYDNGTTWIHISPALLLNVGFVVNNFHVANGGFTVEQ